MAAAVAGRNVGPLDQTIRLAVGTALVMMWIFGPLAWWGLLGFIPLVTGLTRVCPLYPLFGISTCPAPPPAASDDATPRNGTPDNGTPDNGTPSPTTTGGAG